MSRHERTEAGVIAILIVAFLIVYIFMPGPSKKTVSEKPSIEIHP